MRMWFVIVLKRFYRFSFVFVDLVSFLEILENLADIL